MSRVLLHTWYIKIDCKICQEHLCDRNNKCNSTLIELKNREGLIKPSTDVVKICSRLETIIRQYKSDIFFVKQVEDRVLLKLMRDRRGFL